MAMIEEVIARHFNTGEFAFSNPHLVHNNLDFAVYAAGKMVEHIRDQVIDGARGSSACDTEEVGASLSALLAYMGQIGLLVDQLKIQALSVDAAQIPEAA